MTDITPFLLSKLVRASFRASLGHTLVWSDWSNIEARILPWLTLDTIEPATKRINIFKAQDVDKTQPDLYVHTAAAMFNLDPHDLFAAYKAKDLEAERYRLMGKVCDLALGYGGSVGALTKGCVQNGLVLSDEEKTKTVDKWRSTNPWASMLWKKLEKDAKAALFRPLTPIPSARVVFCYDPDYLDGTLSVKLPCSRIYRYPGVKLEESSKFPGMKELTFFRHTYGRKSLWRGLIVENICQAVAGSILKTSLNSLVHTSLEPPTTSYKPAFQVVGHTHDEIITQCYNNDESISWVSQLMKDEMVSLKAAWTEGLPLNCEVTVSTRYKK